MNCREFEASLMQWIDGAADAPTDADMQRHEAECALCRGRGEAERAFERRTKSVLLAGTETVDAVAVLRRSQLRETPATGTPRRLRWPRVAGAIAASLVVAVSGAWHLCIPPFECPYLSAVEAAATAPGTAADRGADLDKFATRVHPPEAILDLARVGDAERTRVDLMGFEAPAVRAHYRGASGAVIVVWSDAMGETPSFRRHTERDGRTWWIAFEHGCKLVAFQSTKSNALCTLVSQLEEEDLLRFAEALRDSEN